MRDNKRKQLKKEIKQIKAVINAFSYKYFFPLNPAEMTEEALAKFDEFRNETLFKLVDQWKKAELELMEMNGLLDSILGKLPLPSGQ